MVDIPQTKMSGKNSADIRMVVDALDLCYSKTHIDVFALLSGDSDFSPLVSKLKENNKRVIGCGVKKSTSDLLIANCDEFIYYDDLIRAARKSASTAKPGKKKEDKKQEATDRLLEVLQSLEQDYDPLWGSLLKQTVRRVYPGFNEGYYGYRSFSELLQDMAARGLIELQADQGRGNYQVRCASRPDRRRDFSGVARLAAVAARSEWKMTSAVIYSCIVRVELNATGLPGGSLRSLLQGTAAKRP